MQQHSSKYFARRPPMTTGNEFKRSKFIFAEYGHAAYQIKGNHECSEMVANILLADPPLLGVSNSEVNFFSEHGLVDYQIKGNDECSNLQVHILSFHVP